MTTNARFLNWFNWLMQWEGTTFENDPDDPGGATKFGIDQRSHPKENIRALTRERAMEIYWDEYWTAVHAQDLPDAVGEVVANIAVNAGRGRASRWLQEAVGAVVDGKIGAMTIHAAWTKKPSDVANALLDRTAKHYRGIAQGKLAKFYKGWMNRNNSLRQHLGLKAA